MHAAHEFISDLVEKISMPGIYLDIRKMMENPNASIGDYENLVETDSMLAIRIIRIANSEFFGFNRKVENLYDAISLIGTIQLHDLLLSSLCMRTFYNIPEQVLNVDDFWLHGTKCGIASRSIARMCRLPASNRFFTLGLLLEIGHAAMFIKTPDLALSSLLESQQQNLSIDIVERKYFGFDYCQLGSVLMEQWQLPDVYSQIIEHHLNPELARTDFRTETIILNLAYHYCDNPGYVNRHASQMLTNQQQFTDIPYNLEEFISAEVSEHVNKVYALLSPPHTYVMSIDGIKT